MDDTKEQIDEIASRDDLPSIVGKLLIDNQRLKGRVEELMSAYDLRILPDFPQYKNETIWINPDFGFAGVEEEVWNYHIGGYQVISQWLTARRGRVLTYEDWDHVDRVVVALRETLRIQGEIDEVIEEHGGWPLAGSVPDTAPPAEIVCPCAVWPGRIAGQHHDNCRQAAEP